ncbi:hypothetical protein Tco_0953116 [Tanacetum coccineum]|uniref:Uncharacterized protein n=1 Tax=Tanacetum coccineum TaxID=301880 RepID=A0ABQ5E1V2_9ASTR
MVVKSEVLNDFPRFFGVLITEFAAGNAVNLTLKMKGDMDVITEFCSPSRWKELSKETGSKILPGGDGSFLEMLVWILEPKSVERASVLHQPDDVGSQRHHIVPIGELNGVLIAFMARSGVISKSTDMIFISFGGQRKELQTEGEGLILADDSAVEGGEEGKLENEDVPGSRISDPLILLLRLLLFLLKITIYGSGLLILSAYAPSLPPLLSLPTLCQLCGKWTDGREREFLASATSTGAAPVSVPGMKRSQEDVNIQAWENHEKRKAELEPKRMEFLDMKMMIKWVSSGVLGQSARGSAYFASFLATELESTSDASPEPEEPADDTYHSDINRTKAEDRVDDVIVVLSNVETVEEGDAIVAEEGGIPALAEVIEDGVAVM